MKTLTIIDTFGFFFRLYYAMSSLKSKDGKPSSMVFGFANFISNLQNEYKSDYLIFALDSKGKTFRSEIDPNYKANRQTPPDGLLAQLPVCIEMIEKMGLCSVSYEGYEADDIIASAVKKLENEDVFINVVTHDKDLYQLIKDGKVSIYSPSKKLFYDSAACYEKYGVYPNQIRDFLAITGDSSDNIPGVKGIGDKGAKKLLEEFKNIEEIYENLDKVSNKRHQNLLLESKENAFLSKKLASLYDNLEIPNLENAKFPTLNPLLKVTDILKSYSLSKILATLETHFNFGNNEVQNDENFKENNYKFEAILLNDEKKLKEVLEKIDKDSIVAFDTETTGLDSRNSKIVGFSFCFECERAYYVPLNHNYLGVDRQIDYNIAKKAILKLYDSILVGHNLKFDFDIIKHNFDIDTPKNYFDTMILSWLENPEKSAGMDNLAKRLFNYDTVKFENIVKKGENFSNVSLKNASKYAAEDAWITLKFYQYFNNNLDKKLLNLAQNLEFPFIKVLLHMENLGILTDSKKLKKMSIFLDKELKDLTNKIYELSKEKFNINSPKQLGIILFEKLNLPSKKKTKTGYSTDESVLNSLLNEHKVIKKLLDYRELYKLSSTYVEPLLKYSLEDKRNGGEGRIYTQFLQTGTITGRLSSKNPNLQNIPARGGLAKDIRDCFVAKSGFSLISLDYSQIELRLLAHFSKDPSLLKAFNDGEDIHTRTAISIFGNSNKDKRAIAKSINFGLIYGMGANKLSNELGISRSEAKDYIERYFKAFVTIKEFLESIKISAKNSGFTTTILGRKRFFDFANARPREFAMYERESVNTKFQGSAADIIKMAMVKIYPLLNENARMLLQIHDELIFEVKDEMIDEFGKMARDIMQNVYMLNVPLISSLCVAKSWGELK
ncbi:DNA polymerase I [Campylobacter ureolyticus]|uniref:DNA polymerase I n=1 Tax=Campylobacter ureolyticus TaxID=827 RepID=UPI0022B2D6D8|nr:DNA polymerase I [Campylobacter ureolyticus]MCZ6167262.1 DNA polymerase I [Campylobacter ureolyticus]